MILICVFILIALGSQVVKRKYLPIYGFICALILSYISFHIEIIPESDLYRHIGQIKLYSSQGLQWAINNGRFQQNPGTQLTFWLLSFLKDYRYVPAIISFIAYGLMYNLIIKIYFDFKYSKKWLMYTMTFAGVCFNYYLLIYAVRMWLVFIVFGYCMYEECVRKKRKALCWSIYVMLIFYHYASLILVMGRVICMLLKPTKNKKEFIKRSIAIICIVLCMMYIWNNYIGTVVLKKIASYESYEVRGKWQVLNAVVRLIGVFCIVLYQKMKHNKEELSIYYNFLLYIIIFMILKFGNYQVVLRFADCLVVMSLAVLPNGNKIGSNKRLTITISQATICLMIISSIVYSVLFDFRNLHFIF